MIEVELPDGTIAEFPDSMSNADIEAVLARQFGQGSQAAPQMTQPSPQITGPSLQVTNDLPAENTQPVSQVKQQDNSNYFGSGIIEPAATIASSIVAEPVAGLVGIAQSLNPFADEGAGAEAVSATREALTYQPKTQAGQENIQSVGNFLKPVGDALNSAESYLGDAAFDATGSPTAAAAASSIPTAALEILGFALGKAGAKQAAKISSKRAARTKQRIADVIKQDPEADVAKYIVNGAGKVKKDKLAINAINEGFDEGVVSITKGASNADIGKMKTMVDVMKRGKKNPKYKALNRPSDVVGDSLLNRYRVVKDANRTAGQQLDGVAKSLKGQVVDVSDAVNGFIDDLDDMGISLNPDTLKLVYQNSDVEGIRGVQSTLNKVIERMAKTKSPNAYDVHRMKRFIDEHVTYGKNAKGLGGKAEIVLKNFRRNLDELLDNNFSEYNRVNSVYSETIDAIDDFQTAAGKKIDLGGANANAAIGTLSRRMLSNAQSRVQVMDAFKKIQDVAKKNGGKFDDDIISQIVFLDELDRVFGPSASTSFQGEIQKGVTSVAQDMATGVPERSALNWLKDRFTKTPKEVEAARFKAINELLDRQAN